MLLPLQQNNLLTGGGGGGPSIAVRTGMHAVLFEIAVILAVQVMFAVL